MDGDGIVGASCLVEVFAIPLNVAFRKRVGDAFDAITPSRVNASVDVFVFPEILFVGVDNSLNERVTNDVAAP